MIRRRLVRPSLVLFLLVAGAPVVVPAAAAPVAAAGVEDPIPTPAGPRGTSRRKSLVIGIDGAGLSRITAADTPVLDRLRKQGTTSLAYRYGTAPVGLTQEASTVSGPGWSTLLTGVWPDKHGVRDNTFVGKRFDRWPDYLTRAERLDPSLSTFAVADWDPIATSTANGPIVSDEIDVRIGLASDSDSYGYAVNDARSVDVAARYLTAKGPDLSFVYLGYTDEAGHAHGSASPEYAESLETADAQIGRLLRAIRARPAYDDERWQIIVSDDHGHTPTGGHGGNSPEERQQFVIEADLGAPVTNGVRRDDLNVTDVAATALAHVRVARAPGLDGTPVAQVEPDAFDRVRPRVPGDASSSALPDGWRVDNRRLPTGGDPDWRGWVLTRLPHWVAAEGGQGRENFVRGRGVVAVADSDEWDDVEHGTGGFDSTLISQRYDVRRRAAVRLSFQTFYQQELTQRGRLSVTFDGGPVQLLRTYDANTYGRQTLRVEVPRGARNLRVRWRYTGDNNWYWAVDDVRVV